MIGTMPSPALTALAAAVLRLPGPPERALEVACGEGDGVLFLAREYPAARVRGLDPSAAAIAAAVDRVGLDPEGRVAFKAGQARALPYPDDFFDLVTQARGWLHAGEIARVLRPGGHLIHVGERRWLDWRLRSHGFEALEAGEVAGARFLISRLPAGDARRE
jgi:ubiquinone/menaquinone biosynthesis C-methylase UbiE